jgi:hypothetical protein
MANEYPKALFAQQNGNLCSRMAENAEQETKLRTEGYKTPDEHWPAAESEEADGN